MHRNHKKGKLEMIVKHRNDEIAKKKKMSNQEKMQYLLNHNVDNKMRHFDANLIHEI